MIKIKKLESNLFCARPEKAMEKFIEKNGIKQENIVSMVPTSTPISRGKLVSTSIILTYNT